MSPFEDDRIDDLDGLWQGLRASDATPDLDEASPEIREAVARMRRAWDRLEPTPALAPSRRAAVASSGSRRFLKPLARVAAAAAFLAATVLPWTRISRPPADRTGGPAPVVADASPAKAPDSNPTLRVVEDGIELRSGPVRLVMLKDVKITLQ